MALNLKCENAINIDERAESQTPLQCENAINLNERAESQETFCEYLPIDEQPIS